MRIWKTNNISDYLKVSAETEGRTIGNKRSRGASPNNGHYSGDSEEDEREGGSNIFLLNIKFKNYSLNNLIVSLSFII